MNDVELIHPGFNCPDKMLTPYPFKVTGVATGFVVGKNIVCGGATMTYTDCHKDHKEGGYLCDRNVDCVNTDGGTKWCTGPKRNECYSYNSLFKVRLSKE